MAIKQVEDYLADIGNRTPPTRNLVQQEEKTPDALVALFEGMILYTLARAFAELFLASPGIDENFHGSNSTPLHKKMVQKMVGQFYCL